MRLPKIAAALATAGACLLGAIAAAPAASAQDATLADVLAAQGGNTDRNWYDFDIIAAGVDAAGLTAALDDPAAELTVFLPNDRAFQALVADLYGWRYFFASEAKILDKLVELETNAPGTLETVILYHVVPGTIDSATALSVPRGTELETLQGGAISVTPLKWFKTAILGDQDPNDFDSFLIPSKLDIQASNGIAHGVGLVLRPADL